MDEQTAVTAVAGRVRALRGAAGLTVEALATRAGVSKGALVALEHAAGNPTLATLVRLADALGRPVSALVETGRPRSVRVVDADAVEPLWRGPAGGSARLVTTAGAAPVEVWRWRLHPGETSTSSAHPAGVVETLTVIRGALVLTVDGADHTVRSGATATFDASAAHAYRGDGTGPCDLVMTVHLPPAP